jgi:hypothetical protein
MLIFMVKLNAFNRILSVAIGIVAMVGFIKFLIPHLEILNISLQVGALIGIISFVLNSMEAATRSRLEDEAKARGAIYAEIREFKAELIQRVNILQDLVNNNKVAIETHASNYGHTESISTLFSLREDITRIRAELAIKGDMVDLQDTMDDMRARFEAMQSTWDSTQIK